MERLVDCSYLTGAASCLEGKSTHIDDLSCFLRLVGEILLADKIRFTADPTGPVYAPAIESARIISDAVGNKELLTHFVVDSINYREACTNAAEDLVADLIYLPPRPASQGKVSPKFEGFNSDPDSLFFEALVQAVSTSGRSMPKVTLKPANASRFVLSQPHVLQTLQQSGVLDNYHDSNDFLRLTAFVRTLIYRQIAHQLNATYLPSSARTKLLPDARKIRPDEFSNINLRSLHEAPPQLSLITAVDSIIRTANGDPSAILRKAWAMRSSLSPVRGLLRARAKGDALAIGDLETDPRTSEIFSVYDKIVTSGDSITLSKCIDIKLGLFFLPVLTIHPSAFAKWFRTKNARKRSSNFAHLVAASRLCRKQPAYNNLVHRTGLSSPDRSTSADGVLRFHGAFIACNANDLTVTLGIEYALRDRGIAITIFATHFHSKKSIQQHLTNCVEDHKRILIVCSASSLNDPYCMFVIEAGLSREAREGGRSVIIPISVDDYLQKRWAPTDKHEISVRRNLLDRVICDLSVTGDPFDSQTARLNMLAKAIEGS